MNIRQKKILYIHQYFKTPKEPGGNRSYWFSLELVKNGYLVTMITARSLQKKLIEKENINGIDVIYIRNAYSNDMGIFRRLISFINFMILSSIVALGQKNVSLIYASSTPLTIGISALICKWLKKNPFFFEVRDLWPEVPIQMGGLINPVAKSLARWLEKLIYRNANHIIALSPGMNEGIIKTGIPNEKISMIPNMSKIDIFFMRDKSIEFAYKFGIDLAKFNVIYFGAMGLANGLGYLIEAAEHLQNQNIIDVDFILMGDGSTKDKLVKTVNEKNLKNVLFIDNQTMRVVSEIVNLCDVSIVPFKNLPILQTNSPNKLFDSLSAGIPIIVNSSGWTKKLVEECGCGAYVDPDNPQKLSNLILKWKSDKNLLVKMGLSARHIAENKYDKSILCKSFIILVDNFYNVKS